MRSIYFEEWRLLLRARLPIAALLLLAAFSWLSVQAGRVEVHRQQTTVQRLQTLQAQDMQRVIGQNATDGDAGYAAYYSYHATWDRPSSLAFAAIGQRDIAPYALRVNALGLQSQLHASEQFNPEAKAAGRFDFAFVLVYLVPIFVIAVFHDLFSGERESGRLRLLLSLPDAAGALWRRRILLRFFLLATAVLTPFATEAFMQEVPRTLHIAAVGVTILYLALWSALSIVVARQAGSSSTHAARLLGIWIAITLLAPTLARLAIDHAVPAGKGADLIIAHREAVHGSWEQPREEIMQRFVQRHPEWHDRAQLTDAFSWKWYYAFHQLADESVAGQATEYRRALEARQRWTERIAFVLPSVTVHTLLHRLADTDLPAQLDYLDSIARYHAALRAFYYPYLFEERTFVVADYAKAPAFAPREPGPTLDSTILAALVAWTLLLAMYFRRSLTTRARDGALAYVTA